MELMLPPEGESQREDQPEAESRLPPTRSVVVVGVEKPKCEGL